MQSSILLILCFISFLSGQLFNSFCSKVAANVKVEIVAIVPVAATSTFSLGALVWIIVCVLIVHDVLIVLVIRHLSLARGSARKTSQKARSTVAGDLQISSSISNLSMVLFGGVFAPAFVHVLTTARRPSSGNRALQFISISAAVWSRVFSRQLRILYRLAVVALTIPFPVFELGTSLVRKRDSRSPTQLFLLPVARRFIELRYMARVRSLDLLRHLAGVVASNSRQGEKQLKICDTRVKEADNTPVTLEEKKIGILAWVPDSDPPSTPARAPTESEDTPRRPSHFPLLRHLAAAATLRKYRVRIVIGEECHATIEEVQDISDTLVMAVSTIEEKLVIDESVTVVEEEAGVSVDEVISVLKEEKEGVDDVDEEAAPTYEEFEGERVPSYEEFASGAPPEPLFQKRNVVLDHGSCLFITLTRSLSYLSTSMQISIGLPLCRSSPPVSASSPTTLHLACHGSLFSPGSPPVLAIDWRNPQRTSPRPLIPPTPYRFFRRSPSPTNKTAPEEEWIARRAAGSGTPGPTTRLAIAAANGTRKTRRGRTSSC
ncbi:hypothetical protein C8R44DRAFT_856512 [Mycena epipterygia]|nr:hypothetical protein C8R44DRAFT_856512 [Mycena epipterygia]